MTGEELKVETFLEDEMKVKRTSVLFYTLKNMFMSLNKNPKNVIGIMSCGGGEKERWRNTAQVVNFIKLNHENKYYKKIFNTNDKLEPKEFVVKSHSYFKKNY
jgi:hypothetical protein